MECGKGQQQQQEDVMDVDMDEVCDFEARELLDKMTIVDGCGGGGEEEDLSSKVVLKGHDRDEKKRSRDVEISGQYEDVDFSDMQLSEDIIKGLKFCRYDKPTPIQLKAIPLGTLNFDLLLQAKSGTGKTCVFTVCILQQIVVTDKFIQAIVVSPCREVAVQIAHVIKSIGAFKEGLKVKEFIGGTSVAQTIRRSKNCHIAVGTPGRLAHMVKEYEMDLSRVKVIALDEADKLMEASFFDDMKAILNGLPDKKQLIATSATYTEIIVEFLEKFMKSAYKIQLDLDNPALCAVDQYLLDARKIVDKPGAASAPIQSTQAPLVIEEAVVVKYACLKEVLRRVVFRQAIIFSNYQLRAEKIYDLLKESNLDVDLLSASRSQEDRLLAFSSAQQGKIRILVATDVASRGIDVEGVDLVINFDIPSDSDVYIHRVGRTGRFGAAGKAMSLCYFENERTALSEFQIKAHFTMWVIESKTELNAINDKPSQSSMRQMKSMEEPLSINDPDLTGWKEAFEECMAYKPEDECIQYYAIASYKFPIKYAEVAQSHEDMATGFNKRLEERKKKHEAFQAQEKERDLRDKINAAGVSETAGAPTSANLVEETTEEYDDDDMFSSDESCEED